MKLTTAVVWLAAALVGFAGPAAAEPAVALDGSPDITADLSGVVVDDAELGLDDLAGPVASLAFPGLDRAADVDAHGVDALGNDLISLDTAASVPASGGGSLFARASDVLRLVGGAYELAFDSAAAGVPAGADVDAVFALGDELFLSFDVAVDLGGGEVAADEDVVRWDGADLSLYADTSSLGVAPAADLDALHLVAATGGIAASFDISGTVDGVSYDDEDLVFFDPGSGSWSLSLDAGAEHAGWGPADLDAATPDFDLDTDGVGDSQDVCPQFDSADQTDTDGNGIGDLCECGDQTGDGFVNVSDILAINEVIFDLQVASPLCDTNNDALCNVADILGVNAKIFGAPAYCSRFPPPALP